MGKKKKLRDAVQALFGIESQLSELQCQMVNLTKTISRDQERNYQKIKIIINNLCPRLYVVSVAQG